MFFIVIVIVKQSKYLIGVTNAEYGIYSQDTKTSQKKMK